MAIKKINHIAIAVKDLDAGIPYYRDVLKLPFHGIESVESAGCMVAFFGCGETEIELVQGVADFAAVNKHIANHGEGLYHIAFEVDDLKTDMQGYIAQGIKLRNPAPKPGANNTIVNYIDPDPDKAITVICELVEKL